MPQSLTNLLIHLVFSTAGREPYLTNSELRREMHHYLGGIVNGKGGHSNASAGWTTMSTCCSHCPKP